MELVRAPVEGGVVVFERTSVAIPGEPSVRLTNPSVKVPVLPNTSMRSVPWVTCSVLNELPLLECVCVCVCVCVPGQCEGAGTALEQGDGVGAAF